MEKRPFNEGLGKKLRDKGEMPKTNGARAARLAGMVIVLVASAVFLATKTWIGN